MDAKKKRLTIICIILIVAFCAALGISIAGREFRAFIYLFAVAVMLLTMPWGWSIFEKTVSKWNVSLILPFPVYIALKLVAAVYLGWLLLLIDTIKLFSKK